MSPAFRSKWIRTAFAVFLMLVLATPAFAQRSRSEKAIEDAEAIDGRVQGYEGGPILLEPGSYALTYAAAAGLTIVCIAVMFKNAKRTHLD